MAENNRVDLDPDILAESSCLVNSSGGLYRKSTVTTVEKYVVIVNKYEEMRSQNGSKKVSILTIANDVKVDWHTAKKAVLCHESGVGYEGMDMGKFRASKVGDRIDLDIGDESYLLWLRYENPFRSRLSYVNRMREDRGVIMSESTVSRWFNHRFAKRATGIKANIVPIDKFRPKNIINYAEFCSYIQNIHPQRLVFTDEKSFKAEEGIIKFGRPDPITGEKPTQIVSSDFRNRYCIMGMMSINPLKRKAVVYQIGKFVYLYKC